jgi:hypothetical protein
MPPGIYRWPESRRAEVESALRGSRTRQDAASLLKIGLGSLAHACHHYGLEPHALLGQSKRDEIQISAPSSPDLPLPELIEARKRLFQRKEAHAEESKLIPVRVKGDRPIGLLLFGDPHLDDDGCDLATLEAHAKLVRETDGLFAGTVGDLTNNWVGRLAHLWAKQGTTACDSWRLAEWFVGEVRDWMFIVGGNHDAWSGAGDPLKWITAQQAALYQSSEVRLGLKFQNGLQVKINARHDFRGSSMWSPTHGPAKALQLGLRDHLAVAGHLHTSGHSVHKCPTDGITMHAVRVATYKRFDVYAIDGGFRDQSLSPCAMVVVDPSLPRTHPDLIKLWWDPAEGAEYLTWKRKRRAA